ncbi:MAG: hypothetical protein EP343_02855 [Deltaproteobacteria bacterium]|nr:MAG: hypothetical protein EP343_02855 [Deltaproteobacteria bacterium]
MKENTSPKKSLARRILKYVGLGVAALLLALFVLAVWIHHSLTSVPIQQCNAGSRTAQRIAMAGKMKQPVIRCPFLKIAKPTTRGLRNFAKDAKKAGMDYWMALFVAIQVTWVQKGFWAVVKGETPNIYALHRVKGVSHCDLYASYLPELQTMAKKMEKEGQLTLQDLVKMKQWVAQQEKVKINEPSKIETALVFVRAGGDLKTGKVRTVDVFDLLQGKAPAKGGTVTVSRMNQARNLAKWKEDS